MGLSATRMAQMSRLLDEALVLDAEGRQRWLETLPPEYRDLEPGLKQALFPQHGATGAEAVNTLPKVGAGSDTQVVSGLRAGERVGPYRLERLLGAGGMAEVWLAERADGAFKREVALKLPMLFRLRKDLTGRFARERDILAGLEHPNIARLYDAGFGSEGLPYLAMEYVHGERLTAWCNRHHLGIRERLKLFLQVLDAVQYAHGHQVIHRDIKPANILVTESGQVRLLDFGVAKLLAHEEDETELTQLYGRALTPEYASPELVRGDAIDVAADVYSLGVVLYELLTGSRPYRVKASSPTLLEQAIATARVERPSTHIGVEAGTDRSTTQDKLARRLKGDLDAIVLKALAKTPTDRYRSADALADDVRRYLSGEPVEARPDRLTYRLAKFVLRNRARLPAAAVVVLALAVVGYDLMRRGAQTAPATTSATNAPAPDVAAAATTAADDKSIAVLPFVDMSEKHDQEYFSDGLSEELIDRLSHSPDLRVIARTSSFYFKGRQATIGEIGRTLKVANVLEGSVRKAGKAMRITAQLVRASDGSHVWSQTYQRNVADIFLVQDEIAEQVVRELKAQLASSSPQVSAGRFDVEAYNLVLEANYLYNRENREDTERAIDFYDRAVRKDPGYALAWARLSLAYTRQARFGWVAPADGVQRARSAAQRALRLDPGLALAHLAQGLIYRNFDWDWIKAAEEFERALQINPNDPIPKVHLTYLQGNLIGNYEQHVAAVREAVAHDPLDMTSRSNLAGALQYAGHLDESMSEFRTIERLDPRVAGLYSEMCITLLLMGKPQQALAAANKETDEPERLYSLALANWAVGQRSESDAALHKFEGGFARLEPATIARVYAFRGQNDASFEWLERAYRQHDDLQELRIDPLFQNIRGDPRYQALVARMHLEPLKQTARVD